MTETDKKKINKPCENAVEGICGMDMSVVMADSFEAKKEKHSLLLHSCCGPCSTAVVERLAGLYKLTVFFYNPNISDPKEYEKRKESQVKFLEKYNCENIVGENVGFLLGEYDPEAFYEVVQGLESEKEGGARCIECFKLRLERTAVCAKNNGFDAFATTLTVSPYKDYKVITEIGNDLSFKYGLTYIDLDFKKKNGYRRSIELSKQYNLYRQHYCGCEFSK